MIRRRGISLIEILFSVGVVGIGLLGVLILVPVAIQQVGKGNDSDRMSRMGVNALAEFEIRGMANMENWRFYSGGFFPVSSLGAQASFAIDPLAMTYSEYQISPAVLPANGTASSTPSMPRYSLRSVPQPLAPAMSRMHAERIFMLRDELVFNQFDDPTRPPSQVFNVDQGPDGEWGQATVDDDLNGITDDNTEAGWPGTDDLTTARQNEGMYSWMATMTPKLDSRTPGVYSENFAQDYVLSIAIFRNRQLLMDDVTAAVPGTKIPSDRVVNVNQIYGDGSGGGDLLLETFTTSTNPVEDLRGVREGNWILLACVLPTYSGTTTTFNYFSWYRVDAIDDEPFFNGTTFQLNVTVSGADWPLAFTVKPGGSVTGTHAAIFKDLIGVYQKVVRLETSSLWSN